MKKRVISLILIFTLLLTLAPVMLETVQTKVKAASWNGTAKTEPVKEGEVYQISSAEELAWFADYINSLCAADTGLIKMDAVLTADIDLGDQEWTPISMTDYVTNAYAGVFDGQNHTVSGLKIQASAKNYGLFGLVNGGTIKNLKVEGRIESNNVVGGMIGLLQTGTVENCSMSGSVISTGTGTKGYAGGITGSIVAKDAVVKGCHNNADISGSYAGGILGCNNKTQAPTAISNCYNTGSITGTTRSGGIAGQLSKGTISYCYSIGQSTNGICGFSNAEVINCYYFAESTKDDTTPPGGTVTGIGYGEITDAATLLKNLNSESSENRFCEDKNNMNKGYPVLDWQLSSAVLSVPVTDVTIQGNCETGSVLTAQATGEEGDSATNVRYQWSVSSDNKNFTELENAAERTYTIADIAEFVGKYIKVTATGEQDSSVAAVIGPITKSEALQLKEDTEKVQRAKEALSLDTRVVKAAGLIELPQGSEGCAICWTSSHPEIISTEGKVSLPEENVVSVTMTAQITSGKATDSKEFNIDVWSAQIDPEQYLEKVLDSMKWDYKLLQPAFGTDTNILIKFQNVLKKKGYDGVTVTVQSTEYPELITENGRICYPAVPEGGSFADGRQVQVVFNLSMGGHTVTYPSGNLNALLVPWDTGDVRASLEAAADSLLTEEAICGDNKGFSSVVTDLVLPSCIEGDRYSYGQITWTSSDETHLAVSDEHRQGSADAFYQPYVGKVYQDGGQHEVTLTAVVQNPSTDITVEKSFLVTILPMGEEQLGQTFAAMSAILDCYTPAKLTDYTTKEALDTKAVTHDIQLVRPKDVVTAEELVQLNYGKYWDYWNYRFTVTSSNRDVIDVNSFRAYVFRPLGEDASADKTVTLQIRMESKNNPNLFVSKEIAVTVPHLGRAEINQALAFMDHAKAGYAEGLLGDNADAYSIIDNLTPYKEIIWKEDQSGVDYVYRHSDMKNNGIIVDELPDWETQEDWRLFRTSDKDLLANETLVLNCTPEEDTFVKISSVLTDETFGKYYVKFQNSSQYDAETLAKFRQLYKQPVHAYFMVTGAGNYTDNFAGMAATEKEAVYLPKLETFKAELDKPITVSFTLLGLEGEELIPKTEVVSFTKGATVFDVFGKVLADHKMDYVARGSYISSVNGLAEFAHGEYSGWMYTVGGVFVNSYMNAQELSGGEEIIVKYVTDYTAANVPFKDPGTTGDPEVTRKPQPVESPDPSEGPVSTKEPSPTEQTLPTEQPSDKKGLADKDNSGSKVSPAPKQNKKTSQKKMPKKKIKILKLIKYKKGNKKITGKTLKKAKVTVQAQKKKYKTRADKKGRFTVKLKKKLKKGMKIRVTVSGNGYRTRTKSFKVK